MTGKTGKDNKKKKTARKPLKIAKVKFPWKETFFFKRTKRKRRFLLF